MSELTEELKTAEFGDQRLTHRLGKLIGDLENKPHHSIPAACDGRAEMEAAYRFFDNPKVNPKAIQAPHIKATKERIRQAEVALLVQDTTELDLTRPQQQVEATGPLEYESRRGLFHHPLIAFNGAGLSLGHLWEKTWARDKIETGRTDAEKQKSRRQRRIEEKESYRWLEGFRAAREVATDCPETHCVMLADSEADVFDVLCESCDSSGGKFDFIIRAAYNRTLDEQVGHLRDKVADTKCLDKATVNVSARRKKIKICNRKRKCERDARMAEVEIRATSVRILPPLHLRSRYNAVDVNIVLVHEANPPEGAEPIEWLLLTTLPIETLDQVHTVITWYTIRWQIEVYFRTLKSGCRIEQRYFENRSRLENCLAVYSIVAWRILYLCRLSRECPDLPVDVVFSDSEWKSVYVTVKKQAPPEIPISLNEMTRLIASLGGYVIRKSTQPGTQTLWFGLQRLHDLANGWDSFGPNSKLKKNF